MKIGLASLVGGLALLSGSVHAPEGIIRHADMGTPRAAHTATRLESGDVLIAGGCTRDGCTGRTASTELYAARSRRFIRLPSMGVKRVSHTATRLADGRVLVAGGWSEGGVTATVEVYDAHGRDFTPTGSLRTARGSHQAQLLSDGNVLIAGGENGGGTLATAEIYDPARGEFRATGPMVTPRASHTGVPLPDGRIMFVGGHRSGSELLSSTEIYDPAHGTFAAGPPLTRPRHKHAAVALADGSVLVIGGADHRDWDGKFSSAELYLPGVGAFRELTRMEEERFKLRDAIVVLENGDVLVGGGARRVEVFEPSAGRFRRVPGTLDRGWMFATATPTIEGEVLIAGGYDGRIRLTPGTWRFVP